MQTVALNINGLAKVAQASKASVSGRKSFLAGSAPVTQAARKNRVVAASRGPIDIRAEKVRDGPI